MSEFNQKFEYRVISDLPFFLTENALESVLISRRVENVREFLNVSESHTHDPFLLRNMEKGLEIYHNNIGEGKKVLFWVDGDMDGMGSSSAGILYTQRVAPGTEIDYVVDPKKTHSLKLKDVKSFKKEFDLIVIPDSGSGKKHYEEIVAIKKAFPSTAILVLDHHKLEYNVDEIAPYACVINCQDGQYPNKTLSGAGVVYKFLEAYSRTYRDDSIEQDYLDLVAMALVADSMDMRNLETRYYVLEGIKNVKNEFIQELIIKHVGDISDYNITAIGWQTAPKINAVTRYGEPQEQIDTFRAFLGEQEEIEYQPPRPKRKNKNEPMRPKPPKEIHSLQKTMARVSLNVKNRQDGRVRKGMKEMDKIIQENELYKDKIIILEATKALGKNSVSGLVANKLASKYQRPVLVLKPMREKEDTFGGSARGYERSSVADLNEFLTETKLFEKCAGHDNAFGIEIKRDRVEKARDTINELLKDYKVDEAYEVDYEIAAKDLRAKDVLEIGTSVDIWGKCVEEPTFVITGIRINANDIQELGNGTIIKFRHNDISFIKKYPKKGEYDAITCRTRTGFGNKKELELTIIGSFRINNYEGKMYPEVKILHYYSEEYQEKEEEFDTLNLKDDDDFIF